MGTKAPHWSKIHQYLIDNKVTPVTNVDAYRLAAAGEATILDVRFAPDYVQWRVEPSTSIPYTYTTALRRLWGLSLWEFGIPIGLRGGLKARDPEFADKVRAAFPDTSTHLMLLDIAGGSLEEPPVPEFATGQGYDFTKSQALQCAYELVQAGYTNLSYVRGGCNDWFEDAHNDAEGVLPKGEGKGPWLGHSEVYAYRQFRMKDPTKGRRTF